MATRAASLIAITVAAVAGCGGGRLQNASILFQASDSPSVGPPGYSLTLSVFGDSACASSPPDTSFTMTLDGAPLPYQDCLAGVSALSEDGPFTLLIRDGGESAQIVVTDLFPGLHSAIVNSTGGPFAPGALFDVIVPPALQSEVPAAFGAQFTYLDGDDPAYPGDVTNPTAGDGVIHVPAPQHAGHFALWVSMTAPAGVGSVDQYRPKATVVSCSGVSSCNAFAAPDIGPFGVDVGALAP